MNLALFDLDHTLIPFDSGLAWLSFLAEQGALPGAAAADYLGCAQRLTRGQADIAALHRALMLPLASLPWPALLSWRAAFGEAIAAALPPARRALVQRHQAAGDLCVLVTATARVVAEPFAALFGMAHLIATESATVDGAPAGRWSGETLGPPCHGVHKRDRVVAWLAAAPPAVGVPTTLAGFARSWFYSDAASDLPLLHAVTDPVAVRPDATLRAHAERAGWPVIAD